MAATGEAKTGAPDRNVSEDPLTSIRPSLQGIRFQVDQQLRAYGARRANPPIAREAASQELWGQLGGALSHEFLGAKRPGSKVARALVAANQKALKVKAEVDSRNQALFILQQLRQAVDSVEPVLEPRFRQSLQRGLAEASSAQRPETILRKVLQVTGRLETYRPPAPKIVREPPFPEVLRQLESGLRKIIADRLSALTPTWWTDRVPADIRTNAEKRKANRDRVWPWLDAGDHPVEEYLGFPDYSRIILDPYNWEHAFSRVFVDVDVIRVKLRELEPIRTDVAHSRKLTTANRRRLEAYAEDLLAVFSAS